MTHADTQSLTCDLSPAPRVLKANDACLANRGAEEVQPRSSEIVTVLELGGEQYGLRVFNLAERQEVAGVEEVQNSWVEIKKEEEKKCNNFSDVCGTSWI